MASRIWRPRPRTVLGLGAKGRAVVWLQQRLKTLGYDVGNADGQYGYLTEDSICSLQREYGLPTDGIAGPDVFALLQDGEVLEGHRHTTVEERRQLSLWGGVADMQTDPASAQLKPYQGLCGVFLWCYTITATGDLEGCQPHQIPSWCEIVGKHRIPVISNFIAGSYSVDTLQGLLGRRRARTALLEQVRHLVIDTGCSGLALDLQGIEPGFGRRFAILVQTVQRVLRAQGKRLYLSLVPSNRRNPFPKYVDSRVWRTVPHRVLLQAAQEYVVGEPGPQLGLSWLQAILARIRAFIPTWRLIVVLPLGGIAWQVDGQRREYSYLSYSSVCARAYKSQARPRWDLVERTPYHDYRTGEVRGRVWYENRKSIKAKLTWLEKQHVGGVILMPLGWEDMRIWQ